MFTAEFIVLAIVSYLVGSVPSAYLAARITRGIDIRKYGTGNVGLGNLWEMVSKRVSIPVIIYDFGKGIGMVLLARALEMTIEQQVVVGLAAVIGHDWPVFLRFSGGRGILTSLGVIIVLLPWAVLVFGVFAILTLPLKSSPLPVLLGLAVVPLVTWLTGQPLALTLGFLVILLITVIRRLTAARPAVALPRRQILLNRLLFDRDIRDREEWMYRLPEQPKLTDSQRARLERKRKKKGLF